MELLYQWRDTNREKNEGNKDQKIFCIDPFNSTCTNIASWYYVIIPKQTETPKVDYFALEMVKTGWTWLIPSDLPEVYSDFSSFLQKNDANFDKIKAIKMNFTGEFKGDANFTGTIAEVMEREAEFYRIIEVKGIYGKKTNTPVTNATWWPVELDACVKTFFISFDGIVGESELCGLLTNFKE